MSQKRAIPLLVVILLSGLPDRSAYGQLQRVKDTVHNLSATGPGTIRAARETEVCVFCHTPHGAGETRPLWNRNLSPGPYLIYQSSSLKANVGQPTGSSKLCLSCHDGTIALGEVLSRDTPITMAGGQDRMPPGPTNLGTDLSDDHPISFNYASSLSAGERELLMPGAIIPPVRLDGNGEMQCTSCHDAHDNSYGDFLLRSNENGALCTSCHRPLDWDSSAHAISGKIISSDVSLILGADAKSVAENACKCCHRTHGAEGPPWILHRENISLTCLSCHDGRVAEDNIYQELTKVSSHGIRTEGPSGITGTPYLEGDRISCADCHNPHATGSSGGTTGNIPESLARVPGVSLQGTQLERINQEYELCLRCHGDTPARVDLTISRVYPHRNLRLSFQPTNPSFHPVGNPGVNPDVPSLIPPLNWTSQITCGDCHDSNDSRKLGGTGPAGPHGSAYAPLLSRRYEMVDSTSESPQAYALCYQCHFRDSILGDFSFPFHRLHIVEERTPCSVCHDAHGISSAHVSNLSGTHLINFDRSVVYPNRSGVIGFLDTGRFSGECTLTCHGKVHEPERY